MFKIKGRKLGAKTGRSQSESASKPDSDDSEGVLDSNDGGPEEASRDGRLGLWGVRNIPGWI